jgi:DNA-binding Lrp family transcriptional regulator
MKSQQLSELSANLNRAINPNARKRAATSRILDQVEPLPQLLKLTSQTGPAGLAESAKLTDSPIQPDISPSDSVKSELRIPYLILDALIPTLSPAESLVYLRLYRLSYGFNRETCKASIWKLGRAVNLSERTTHRAVYLLEQRGLIKRTGHVFGRNGGGLIFKVNCPPIGPSQVTDIINIPENPPRDLFFDCQENEKPLLPPDPHLEEVITAYERETNNQWRPSDASAYEKVKHVPTEKIIQAIISAKARSASRPNSFSYFIKEILDQANPSSQSRISRMHALKKIVDRIRSLHVGAHNYTSIDFVEDVKTACAREGVSFDNDLFNELMS